MAWHGWLQLDGIEIANIARTDAYLRHAGVEWYTPAGEDTAELELLLGETYASPLQDDAPWTDPDSPASYEFLGFYPTSMSGVEDSTGTAEIIEFITDGGVPGRRREATRAVVVGGLLMATSEAGADYGMQWLKSALRGGPCSNGRTGYSIFGSQLCYLSSPPRLVSDDSTPGVGAVVDGGDAEEGGPTIVDGGDSDGGDDYLLDGGDAEFEGQMVYETDELFVVPPVERFTYAECWSDYLRSLRKLAAVQGPSIDRKMVMSDNSAVWAVQFTAVAGMPWQFSSEVEVLRGFLDPTVADPIVDPDVDYQVDTEGFIYTDVDCEEPLWGPLYDPLCPVLIAPPAPVDIALSCVTVPANWLRRQVVIPESVIPLWGDVVPQVTVRAAESDLRSVRIRFYSDPYATADPNADPCSYCGDLLVTYVPYQGSLVIDGASETVYVDMPGGERRRADSLVVGSDSKPFLWPKLTCGFQYVMTVDAPRTQAAPIIDLSLVPRNL